LSFNGGVTWIKQPVNIAVNHFCKPVETDDIVVYGKVIREKKNNSKVSILRKTKAIRILQTNLRKELITLLQEIDKTLHPENYEQKLSWIEKKYPCSYPSLSAEFQRWERGQM
jgi:hypothetical protein